jgi:hypothetical protein
MLAYMVRWLLAGAFLGACGFQAVPEPGDNAPEPLPPEEAPVTGDDIVNIATADEMIGIGDLTIAAPITIDTGTADPATLAFGMALPPGLTFTVAKLNGTGPELAVLRAHALAVQAHVQVIGSRPLVVLANTFDLSDAIDVTAHANPAGSGVLSSHSGGAIEIYARTQIAISGNLTAGTTGQGVALGPPRGGASGAIILQSPALHNAGHLSANGGDQPGELAEFGGGGGNNGQIVLLYRTTIAIGATNPLAIPQIY